MAEVIQRVHRFENGSPYPTQSCCENLLHLTPSATDRRIKALSEAFLSEVPGLGKESAQNYAIIALGAHETSLASREVVHLPQKRCSSLSHSLSALPTGAIFLFLHQDVEVEGISIEGDRKRLKWVLKVDADSGELEKWVDVRLRKGIPFDERAAILHCYLEETRLLARFSPCKYIARAGHCFARAEHNYSSVRPAACGDLITVLNDHLHQTPPDTEAIATDIETGFLHTLYALQYIHEQGYVHRDPKPENLLKEPEGHFALTDFEDARPSIVKEEHTRDVECARDRYLELLASVEPMGITSERLTALRKILSSSTDLATLISALT